MIVIDGLEMPKEGGWISVNIFPGGKCFIQSWCGKDFNFAEKLTAIPVPPHGRLIDADVAEVESEWTEENTCSHCGEGACAGYDEEPWRTRYCPHCGVKMTNPEEYE